MASEGLWLVVVGVGCLALGVAIGATTHEFNWAALGSGLAAWQTLIAGFLGLGGGFLALRGVRAQIHQAEVLAAQPDNARFETLRLMMRPALQAAIRLERATDGDPSVDQRRAAVASFCFAVPTNEGGAWVQTASGLVGARRLYCENVIRELDVASNHIFSAQGNATAPIGDARGRIRRMRERAAEQPASLLAELQVD